MKLFFIASFCCIFTGLTEAQSGCDGWEPYKDEKCFKIIEHLANYTTAHGVCASQSAQLVSIDSLEEQSFLHRYFFNTEKVVDNIWLGARVVQGGTFKWSDESNLTYTNWAGSRQTRPGYCVQMNAEDGLRGKWTDVSCSKKNLVVCQKVASLAPGEMNAVLFTLRRDFQKLVAEQKMLAEQRMVAEQKLVAQQKLVSEPKAASLEPSQLKALLFDLRRDFQKTVAEQKAKMEAFETKLKGGVASQQHGFIIIQLLFAGTFCLLAITLVLCRIWKDMGSAPSAGSRTFLGFRKL